VRDRRHLGRTDCEPLFGNLQREKEVEQEGEGEKYARENSAHHRFSAIESFE